MNYEKVSSKLAEFCESLNNRRKALSKSDILDCYRLSFDAHYQLVTIHPWADGNGRMSRLLMNQLQFEFGIIPTNINKERKAEYIEALVATRESEDLEVFRRFMFDEHIRSIELMIQNYQTSIANESIGNYDTIPADDGLNDGLKLSERLENILSLVEKDPGITVEEIANALHISKPTTEREMAFLKSKNKLLRVGSKKAGTWKINRDKE
jgi:Fic family protein